MIKELHAKLAPKNKLVSFYQQGKLSEDEFQNEMSRLNLSEKQANEMFGGIEDASWEDLHGEMNILPDDDDTGKDEE